MAVSGLRCGRRSPDRATFRGTQGLPTSRVPRETQETFGRSWCVVWRPAHDTRDHRAIRDPGECFPISAIVSRFERPGPMTHLDLSSRVRCDIFYRSQTRTGGGTRCSPRPFFLLFEFRDLHPSARFSQNRRNYCRLTIPPSIADLLAWNRT